MMEPMTKQNIQSATLSDILTDVSIREGSQQDLDLRGVGVAKKIELLNHCIRIGVKRIELTAFAKGEWFSDAFELTKACHAVPAEVVLRALYFNTKGLEQLLSHPRLLREGIFHTAVTPSYREKNYNQTTEDKVLEKLHASMDYFEKHALKFDTLVLSTAWGEPAHKISKDETVSFAGKLVEAAVASGAKIQSVTLADTEGVASPEELADMFCAFRTSWPDILLRAHLHPATDKSEEAIYACFDVVDEWEASWCGLGGSPFAQKPGGNLDIRWLIKVFNSKGLEHGFQMNEVLKTIEFLKMSVKREIMEISL